MSPSSAGRLGRGDVVLIRFPFSDLSADKRRPAIVLTDVSVVSGPDRHFVFVGSNAPPAGEGVIIVQAGSSAAKEMGLRYPPGQTQSYIRPFKLATLDASMVTRKIGTVPASIMANIDSLIRFALGV